MSHNFRLIRLGDLCDTVSGLWTGKKPPYEKAIVIRNTNFTKDCKLDLSNVAVLDVETKQLQTRRLLPGDLILEKSGGGPKQAVGRVVLFSEPTGTYSLSNFTSALRLKDSNIALHEYLQHFLYFQYVSGVTESMQSHSTGIRNLNIHQFLDIQIPLPSLERQREIVEKLDSAFEEIEAASESIKIQMVQVLEAEEAYIDEKLGSKNRTFVTSALKELTSKIGSGATPRGGEESYKNEGISLIRSLNVHDDGFRDRRLAYIDEIQALALSNVEVLEGDVLLNITGASIARTCIAPKDYLPARVNQHVAIIRPKPNLLKSEYLHYALRSRSMKEKLLGIGSAGGSTRQALTKVDIENTSLCFPRNVLEQSNLVLELNTFCELIQKLSKNLKYLEKLYSELGISFLAESFEFVD